MGPNEIISLAQQTINYLRFIKLKDYCYDWKIKL